MKPIIRKENVKTLFETKFIHVFDLQYAEGKHYYVAISHAAKKLVRLIYHLQMTGEAYCPQT